MTSLRIPSNFFRWSAFVGDTILLYIALTLPLEKIPAFVTEVNDKLLHFLNFFLLALLGYEAFFYSSQPVFHRQAEGKAFGFSLLYGAYLEYAQREIPGRSASFSDWVANAIGVLAAFFISRISRLSRRDYPDPLK